MSLDNCLIASPISTILPLYETALSPAIVLTFAIAVSKLIDASVTPLITPMQAVDTGAKEPPIVFIAPPTAETLFPMVALLSVIVLVTSFIACFTTPLTVFLPMTMSNATAPTDCAIIPPF